MITTLTVRLHPVPTATRSLSIALPHARAAQELVVRLNHSTITPIGLQVMSAGDGYAAAIRLAGVPSSVDAQTTMLERLAAEQNLPVDVLDERAAVAVWTAHETIYEHPDAMIARWSVLPTALATALETMSAIGSRLGLDVHLVVQGTGTGLVRFHGANEQALLAAIGATRARLAEHGGFFVVQRCAPSLKERLDVWGSPGDTFSLMQRVKTHFDPQGTLNPGRYVGRI
jgi:glycolate oxidase FAD binding subunit